MRWKDGSCRSVRAIVASARGVYRFKSTARTQRSVGGLTVAMIGLALLSAVLRSWILLVAGATTVFVLNAARSLYFGYFIRAAEIADLNEMTEWEFERWLRGFFEAAGYGVQPTPYRGDFGADFVLKWNGMRIAVHARRSSQPVGVRAVQEVVAAKAYYDCEQAMVVTNNHFTDRAMILARANGVWTRTRDDLAKKAAGLGEVHQLTPQHQALVARDPGQRPEADARSS